jgi:threonine dehydrogenase-like Zn-dependent dehydrogenase
VRQLTVVEKGRLEWLDVPEPRIEGPDEALVRPIAVATCDLDPLMIQGMTPFPFPIALGHECTGTVVDVGDDVQGIAVGDVVAVPFQISCGTCERCRQGRTGNCASVPFMSTYGFGAVGGEWGGALSDLVRVPFASHMLVPLRNGADPVAVASLGDNIADAWRTVAPQIAERPGARVLVVGGGAWSIGLYAAGMAVALGAERVTYLDDDEDRLERARRLGAKPLAAGDLDPEKPGRFDITVDASANRDGLRTALRGTAPDGTCTSVSIFFEPETPMPLLEMYTKCVTFHTGRVHARPAMTKALALVSAGSFSPEIVTKQIVARDDAAYALAEHVGKHVVVWEASGS